MAAARPEFLHKNGRAAGRGGSAHLPGLRRQTEDGSVPDVPAAQKLGHDPGRALVRRPLPPGDGTRVGEPRAPPTSLQPNQPTLIIGDRQQIEHLGAGEAGSTAALRPRDAFELLVYVSSHELPLRSPPLAMFARAPAYRAKPRAGAIGRRQRVFEALA